MKCRLTLIGLALWIVAAAIVFLSGDKEWWGYFGILPGAFGGGLIGSVIGSLIIERFMA